MRLFRSHYQMIFIVQTLDRLQGWEIRTQGILYMSCRLKKRVFLCFLHWKTLGGVKIVSLPQFLRPQLCHHEGICLVVSCHPPASLPAKVKCVVCEFLWDVGSDFQTPGLPWSGGEQHVLVPQVAEDPHLDHHLTSLCVNRKANIFSPLHDIFLALSCQELDMKYLSLIIAHRVVFTAMLLVLVTPGQVCGIRKTSINLSWFFNSRFSMCFSKEGSPREKGMKTQFSERFDTYFSSPLATGAVKEPSGPHLRAIPMWKQNNSFMSLLCPNSGVRTGLEKKVCQAAPEEIVSVCFRIKCVRVLQHLAFFSW